MLIAVGIGLHNFGEGLAIGSAFALGEAALGTLLIVGFTLHNTTEGLAIVAPLARERQRVSVADLAKLGLIGGVPTIAGAWLGGFVYSPVWSVLFLADRRRRHRAGDRADRPADGARRIASRRTLATGAGAGGAVRRICGDVRHGDAGRMSILGRKVSAKVVAAMAAMLLLVALLPAVSSTPTREITLVVKGMAFYLEGDLTTPNPTIEVKAGERVRVVLRNQDRGMTHDFAVPAVASCDERDRLERVRTTSCSMCRTTPGTYEYVCQPHRLMMRGTIRVS